MKMKSLLFGIAGAFAVTGVQAADLPAAPEPVDYVRICDAYGSGFYYIPGTETCIRVFGRIRADYRYVFTDNSNNESWRFRARAYLRVDTRTNTEYGLLRTYMDIWFTSNDNATPRGGFSTTDLTVFRAFIQFGGLTAGHTASFFDNGYGTTYWASFAPSTSDTDLNLIAYTWAFGNGVSASISVESGVPNQLGAYTGVHWPDLVANVRVDQGWGSAQLSFRAHHVRRVGVIDDFGWSVNLGVEFNIPQFNGSRAFIQGTFGEGNVGSSHPVWDCTRCIDFIANTMTQHWSVRGGISVPFTPQVRAGLDVSYMDHDARGRFFDFSRWDVQGNIVYRPVSGLQFGFEIDYRNIDQDSNVVFRDTSDWVATFRIQRDF